MSWLKCFLYLRCCPWNRHVHFELQGILLQMAVQRQWLTKRLILFLALLEFELRAFTLNHSTSSPQPFFGEGFFWDRVSQTICPGWLQTMILLISASWVAMITGVSTPGLGLVLVHIVFYLLQGIPGTLEHDWTTWQRKARFWLLVVSSLELDEVGSEVRSNVPGRKGPMKLVGHGSRTSRVLC
jgi:hypothetical protein